MNHHNNQALWYPSECELTQSNIAKTLCRLNFETYEEFYRFSITEREKFWADTCKQLGISFQKPFEQVLLCKNNDVRYPQWFVGAQMNIIESCFQADPLAIAISCQNEQGAFSQITYQELWRQVKQVAFSLKKAGYLPGDVIGLAIPMHETAVVIYLGIIMAGCVVCPIAESFASDEIATRLRIANAKTVITQDFFIRNHKRIALYQKVKKATEIPIIVICHDETLAKSISANDQAFSEFLHPTLLESSVGRRPEAPITILFSSGTTGEPKAILWNHTTPIKSASDAYYHLNLKPGDRFCWPTSLGWMMGPFLVFATFINQGHLCLYDGSPLESAFGRFIQEQQVNCLGVVPSLVKQWRRNKDFQQFNWASIKLFSSTGECSNSDDMKWLSEYAGIKPIIEYCGGTEIGGGYITGTVLQPFIPSTFTTPALGLSFVLLDEKNQPSRQGEVALIPPSIGLTTSLLNQDHDQVYFQGMPLLDGTPLRRHGDELEQLDNGYFRALGRADDTMNLGGIKVSATEIERVLGCSEYYVETAAIAISPMEGGPSQLVIYYVPNVQRSDNKSTLLDSMQLLIRDKLNPLFKIHDVVAISALPRTASNKVMRRVLRSQYNFRQVL